MKWFQYENWSTAWQNQQNDLCAQRRLRSAWASAQSDQSQRCPPEAKLGPNLPTERTAKTLIRLGGCPGWSESSLGTKVILLGLSWGGSKCFFLESIYAAHIHFITFFTFRTEPNMKSFSHDVKLIKLFSLANGTWCAVTVPSFDFVKDDCAVGSAVLGKRGYNHSSTQSMVLFRVKPTEIFFLS